MEIKYSGKYLSINADLLYKQKAWGNLDKIIHTRVHIMEILERDPEGEHAQILAELEFAEYELQKAWNFPQDKNYHSYQWSLQGCTCPKMDNKDAVGTGIKYTRKDCPWHGGD